jgi:hypothetical protein
MDFLGSCRTIWEAAELSEMLEVQRPWAVGWKTAGTATSWPQIRAQAGSDETWEQDEDFYDFCCGTFRCWNRCQPVWPEQREPHLRHWYGSFPTHPRAPGNTGSSKLHTDAQYPIQIPSPQPLCPAPPMPRPPSTIAAASKPSAVS